MAVKCINDKPVRPLEVDLSGDNGNVNALTAIVFKLWESDHLNNYMPETIEEIVAELKSGDFENALWLFEYYFGDYVIIYK